MKTEINQILSKPASEMTPGEMSIVLREAYSIAEELDDMLVGPTVVIGLVETIDKLEELFTIARIVMTSFSQIVKEELEEREVLIANKVLEIISVLERMHGPTVDCRFLRDLAGYFDALDISKIVIRKLIDLAENINKVGKETQTQQKLYGFTQLRGLTCIDLEIHPKLAEKLVNRVVELTNNRVIYSAEKQRFVGRDASSMLLAYRINKAIETKARSLASDKLRIREIAVTIDLDDLDSELQKLA